MSTPMRFLPSVAMCGHHSSSPNTRTRSARLKPRGSRILRLVSMRQPESLLDAVDRQHRETRAARQFGFGHHPLDPRLTDTVHLLLLRLTSPDCAWLAPASGCCSKRCVRLVRWPASRVCGMTGEPASSPSFSGTDVSGTFLDFGSCAMGFKPRSTAAETAIQPHVAIVRLANRAGQASLANFPKVKCKFIRHLSLSSSTPPI